MTKISTFVEEKSSTTLILSTCPCCGDKGYSVAALHNKEYKVSENHGEFLGSGIGLTTGGIGIGIATGRYEEMGTQSSKRAIIFAEPDEPQLMCRGISISSFTRGCLICCILLLLLRINLHEALNPSISNTLFDPLTKILESFLTIHIYILPTIILTFFAGSVSLLLDFSKDNSVKDKQIEEENKIRLAAFNKKLNRYNAMRYCESCHLLYDNEQNKTGSADSQGFQMMLSAP